MNTEQEKSPYWNMKKVELIAEAKKRGIEFDEMTTRSQLVGLIDADDDKYKEESTDVAGKTITTREHADGRKDVNIEVNMLDIDATDEETAKAKEVIERDILPNLQAAMVMVVIIHRHSTISTSHKVPLPHVRKYAEAAVASFRDRDPHATDDDFIVVEVHEGTMLTRVSTLEKL